MQRADGGAAVPFYVIPFDKDGRCTGPVTLRYLLDHLAEHERSTAYSDIFLFSHGWNTPWPRAVEAYETFISGFSSLHADLPDPREEIPSAACGRFLAECRAGRCR
jgi:hypothetical protein